MGDAFNQFNDYNLDDKRFEGFNVVEYDVTIVEIRKTNKGFDLNSTLKIRFKLCLDFGLQFALGCTERERERERERDDSWKKNGKKKKKGKENFIHYKVKYKCIKLELFTG